MHQRFLLVGLALFLALPACPEVKSTPVQAACTKFGEKCVTEKGPLGVCETATCPEGQSGPCLKCNPQH